MSTLTLRSPLLPLPNPFGPNLLGKFFKPRVKQSTVTRQDSLEQLLRFPKLEWEGLHKNFADLEAYLTAHPRCRMIVLADYPTCPTFKRDLQALQTKLGAVVSVIPLKHKAAQEG